MARLTCAFLAAALIMTSLGARGADLVVWWEKGWYPQEDAGLREIIAAFEQETDKQVELALYPEAALVDQVEAALEAGPPPDFLYGGLTGLSYSQWAYEGRLVDLSDKILPFASLFDPDSLAAATLFDATAGRRALFALPMGLGDQPCPRLARPARAGRVQPR
jgi:multiple sugar transport system substrate-binding protein